METKNEKLPSEKLEEALSHMELEFSDPHLSVDFNLVDDEDKEKYIRGRDYPEKMGGYPMFFTYTIELQVEHYAENLLGWGKILEWLLDKLMENDCMFYAKVTNLMEQCDDEIARLEAEKEEVLNLQIAGVLDAGIYTHKQVGEAHQLIPKEKRRITWLKENFSADELGKAYHEKLETPSDRQ